MSRYAPREWLPHERPTLPGSPSTPLHSPRRRVAFAVVGFIVAITGGLGNALVAANLVNLQGELGVTSAEATTGQAPRSCPLRCPYACPGTCSHVLPTWRNW